MAPIQLSPVAQGHPPVSATALECALARHVHEQSAVQLSLVRALCEAGASPDLSGRPGETTPLLWACGDVSEGGGAASEVVRMLVKHGADPGVAVGTTEGVPLSGTTPLATAVNNRNKSVVNFLLSLERVRETIDTKAVVNGFTPLITASAMGDYKLCQMLLMAGASTRPHATLEATAVAEANGYRELGAWMARVEQYHCPLCFASSLSVRAVRELLGEGADPHERRADDVDESGELGSEISRVESESLPNSSKIQRQLNSEFKFHRLLFSKFSLNFN